MASAVVAAEVFAGGVAAFSRWASAATAVVAFVSGGPVDDFGIFHVGTANNGELRRGLALGSAATNAVALGRRTHLAQRKLHNFACPQPPL